jgi:D-arabinitol 4-dehydrogenase
MLDRITPPPDATVRERVRAATGHDDAAAVLAEEFRQWVVEDDFRAGRPALEQAGVQFVASVAPFEEAKCRIRNASHTAIAWAGVLAGMRYVHEGALDPAVCEFARDYILDAVIPCLEPSPLDLEAYGEAALARFGNAALADTNQHIVQDSYAKLQEFIVPTVRQRLAARAPLRAAAALPALYLAFLQRWHRGELPFEYVDAALDEAEAHGICADADPVRALAGDATLWAELAGDDRLVAALRTASARVAEFVRDAAQ